MRKLIILLLLLTSAAINGQIDYYFSSFQSQPCPADSTRVIKSAPNVEIYQTIDNTPFGVLDSDRCFPVRVDGFTKSVDLADLDVDRLLFFRHKVYANFLAYPVQPNTVLSVQGRLNGNMDFYDNTLGCEGPDCTQMILGFTVPNADTTDLISTLTPLAFDAQCDISTCVTTQAFSEGQYLREALYQIKLTGNAVTEGEILFPSLSIYDIGVSSIIVQDDQLIPEEYYTSDNHYEVPVEHLFPSYEPVIFAYHESTYPSNATRSYIDFNLEENKDTVQNINIVDTEYMTFLFQNFVSIRGGLVAGSDSIRHNLNFEISTMMCFFIIELVMGSGTTVSFHKGGGLDLRGASACLQLRDGARMTVESGHDMTYGIAGIGNLALKDNAIIEVRSGASLTFDGNLMLDDYDRLPDNNQASIILEPESTLTFTEKSKITSNYTEDMKINVYMNGGTLNLSDLNPEYRSKLNLIYPSREEDGFFSVFPNPASEYISLPVSDAYVGSAQVSQLTGADMQTLPIVDGRLDISDLGTGVYVVSYAVDGVRMMGKFVVAR